jgi:NADP-dependent 3-hydroxy acid dehydrogenase YdfG
VTLLPLAGQTAVVSGATSAVGRAICQGLATAGAQLCVLGRDVGTLEKEVAKIVRGLASPVWPCPVDLAMGTSIAEATARLLGQVGAVDVLIHSAGVFEMGPHESAPVGDLDRQYQTNVRGPYLLTQALLPHLRARQGQIIFINSTVGLESRASVGQYAATQHALRAVADALRAEVNPAGVRVLSVYLGRTATARQARIFRQEGRPYAPELLIQPDDVAQMVMATLQLPRTAEVTEIRMRPLVKSY